MKKKMIVIAGVILVVGAVLLTVFMFNNQKHKVQFFVNDKVVKVEEVKHGFSATPPIEPQVPYGSVFSKWDKDISNIKQDLDVHAVLQGFSDKTNVITVSSAYGDKGDEIFIPVSLCGNVCLCGLDCVLTYDADAVELISVFDEDGSLVYNKEEKGKIYLNYTSIKNTDADVDLCMLKFKVLTATKNSDIKIAVTSIYALNEDNNYYKPEYNTIDSKIYSTGE